jgi:hypothetical protein
MEMMLIVTSLQSTNLEYLFALTAGHKIEVLVGSKEFAFPSTSVIFEKLTKR